MGAGNSAVPDGLADDGLADALFGSETETGLSQSSQNTRSDAGMRSQTALPSTFVAPANDPQHPVQPEANAAAVPETADAPSLDAWSCLAYAKAHYADRLALVDLPPSAQPQAAASVSLYTNERLFTYCQLHGRALHAASALLSAGVHAGSRVAVLLRNRAEVLELHYAAAALRAVIVNVNTHLAPPELRYILHDCEAEVLVADMEAHGEALSAAMSAFATDQPASESAEVQEPRPLPRLHTVFDVSSGSSSSSSGITTPTAAEHAPPSAMRIVPYHAALEAAASTGAATMAPLRAAAVAAATAASVAETSTSTPATFTQLQAAASSGAVDPADPDAPFHMYYTSGTTGHPKGVLLSHRIVMLHALGTIQGRERWPSSWPLLGSYVAPTRPFEVVAVFLLPE